MTNEERNFRWAYALLIALAKAILSTRNVQATWEELGGPEKSALLRLARKAAGIPEEDFLKIEKDGTYVVDDIFEGQRLVSEREAHLWKMEHNPDYRETFEKNSIRPGKLTTVVLNSVDQYATREIFQSLFGQDVKLVGGCKVTEIHFCDLSAKHEDLRRGINNALLADSSTSDD